MSRSTATRALIAALTIAAFTAPAASARPDAGPTALALQETSREQRVEPLHRRAADAVRTSSLAATSSRPGPVGDTRDDLHPQSAPASQSAVARGGGAPWTMIAIGIAVLIGGTAVFAGRNRRAHLAA